MASNPVEIFENRAPVLVLGLGNILLGDDGLGPAVIEHLLQDSEESTEQIELIDGGTQGLALLGHLGGREAIIIVDALATGAPPGTIRIMNASEIFSMGASHAESSHESNARELLVVAKVLNELPDRVFVVGVEPQNISTGYGLSESASRSLPIAAGHVRSLLTDLRHSLPGSRVSGKSL